VKAVTDESAALMKVIPDEGEASALAEVTE